MFHKTDDIKDKFSVFKAFKEGEEQAFDFFFRKYYAALCSFAFTYLKDTEQAQDLVQECFVKLWEKHTSMSKTKFIKSFLYTTVRNSCIDTLRRKKVMDRRLEQLKYIHYSTIWEPEEIAEITYAETMRKIHAAIETLPPKTKQVFRMYFIEGKSHDEIAEELHRSPGTVRNQKDRALVLLKGKILPLTVTILLFLQKF